MLSKSKMETVGAVSKLFTTASANGCSDCFSMLNRISLNLSSLCIHTILVTSGFPSVIVPVLSKTMALTFFVSSKLSASLIKIPFSAPFPTPTIMAVGVANPRAQGHAITNTVTRANNPCVNPSSPPNIIHEVNANKAIPITIGTKIPAILSTNF